MRTAHRLTLAAAVTLVALVIAACTPTPPGTNPTTTTAAPPATTTTAAPPATTSTTTTSTTTTTTTTTTTAPPASGTVAAWEHNESAGASTLVDSSGNGLDGTVGSSVTTGLTFGGVTYHGRSTVDPDTSPYDPGRLATIPSATKLNPDTGEYAVTIRFRTTAPDGNIAQKGQSGTTGGFWKIEMNAGKVTCLFRGGNGDQRSVETPAALNNGSWQTLRCERTAAGVTLFVNGSQVATRAGSTGNVANTHVFAIGGKASCNQSTVGCDYYSGDIDYVRVTAD